MNKKDVQKRVLKGGKPLPLSKFSWDEKTLTFSSAEDGVVIDFGNVLGVTIDCGDYATIKCGEYAAIKCGWNATIDCGDYATIDCGWNATIKCGGNATIKCGWHATIDCGWNATIDCGWNAMIKCGGNAAIKCGGNAAIKCGCNATIDCGGNAMIKCGGNAAIKCGGDGCVIIRRGDFDVIQPEAGQTIQTCPYGLPGHLVDGKLDGVPHIIADGILSRIVKQKGNVYKVVNHGEDNESWLICDGDDWSHGATLEGARNSLIYKRKGRDTSAYEGMTLETEYTLAKAVKMYRTVTGACASGVESFVKSQDSVKEAYTVADILKLTEGHYGNEALKQFLDKQKGTK